LNANWTGAYRNQRSGKQPEDTYFTTKTQASPPRGGGGVVTQKGAGEDKFPITNACTQSQIPYQSQLQRNKQTLKSHKSKPQPPCPQNSLPCHTAPCSDPARRHSASGLQHPHTPAHRSIRRRAAVHAHALRHVDLRPAEVRPAGTYAEDVAAVLGLREEAGGWRLCHRRGY